MSDHKLRLIFRDGDVYATELICPPTGCTGATFCTRCGGNVHDEDHEPCVDCPDGSGECWVKTWADNVDLTEYMAGGELVVDIRTEWDCDSLAVYVEGASS